MTERRLSARRVATITDPGYHADGGGLYLQVTKTGAKTWVYRFSLNGHGGHRLRLIPGHIFDFVQHPA